MEEMPDSEGVSFCLSFKFYSSGRCEETAAKFTEEKKPLETLTDTEDDIDFTFVLGDSDLIADETSGEGQIRQLFPIFNPDLPVRNGLDQSDGKKPTGLTLRLPLQKLFADELESVPAGEYSVWRPKAVDSSSRYKKCGSTGSALKRWKLRDLLLLRRRSNSEGKEGSSVFMTPKNRELKAEKQGRLETTKAGKEKAKEKVYRCRLTKCFTNGIQHVWP
ncbi:uncharacterized protein LOC131298496 [Rhododendron vialii]|uniref:uncharacterized protein LOC131298496 n=1 Tax=Rhododendron vialii TaxID=182163 RepID=UPI00265D8FF9|nr:uncharacterized protein LOC131298496 [Rhododendron vialii]